MRVGIGTRSVGPVEQLPAILIPARDQVGPESLDNLGQMGQAGPGLDVLDRRRPESSQVAQDQVIDRRVAGKGTPQPVLGSGVGRGPIQTPDSPGWKLDEGDQVAHRVGQRVGVTVGPTPLELAAKLTWGARRLGEGGPSRRGHLREVQTGETGAVAGIHGAVEHRLQQGPKTDGIPGGDQVDGPPQ